MSRKLLILGVVILVFSIGFGFWVFHIKADDNELMKQVKTLTELPFEIERANPVPEIRNWSNHDRSFYYFNWGLQPASGYSLNLLSVKGKKIKIQALSPRKDSMVAQVITYPYLYLSLPKGQYQVEVVDNKQRPVSNFFTPKNKPLKLILFLPDQNGNISRRIVLRDPYLNNEGKTTAQIALDALFAQDEMLEYLDREVMVEGVSYSIPKRKWLVLLSRNYESLAESEKNLLADLITKTILAIKADNLDRVEITTNPSQLPLLKN